MRKKLLVLGIGPSQVDLIKIAKEMNMIVYACAYEDSGPGLKLVDDFKQTDVKDVEAVKNYAKEKDVDFIYSMALELAIPTITKASEDLSLANFCSSTSLEKLINKYIWRSTLGDMEGNVTFSNGKNEEDFKDWETYPAILKPVDGSGQRGVYKVDNYEDVKNKFYDSIRHSRSKELIIEDYVDGSEISVNSFMYNGELAFALISDRISYFEYPGGIIKEHHIPSAIVDKLVEEKVINMVEEVNRKIGFENGHIYFQLKIEDNEPKIIEFTPRFDGCHMWRLVYLSTGLDLRRVALEVLAYGKSNTLESYVHSEVEGNYKLKFISDKPGLIVSKDNYHIPEDNLYSEIYYNDGDRVKTVTGYMEKLGYYIVKE